MRGLTEVDAVGHAVRMIAGLLQFPLSGRLPAMGPAR